MNLSLEAARERLAKLPRQQPAVVVDELRALLDHLAASPPAQDAHIALLEEIAPLLSTALAALSSRYHDKPLPLAEPEELQFQTTLAAWQALGKAYAQCLQREESQHPAAPDFPKRMARLLQRRLLCCSQIIIEHYLARRALPPGTWLELHRLYRAAEAGRVNRMVVNTPAPEALPAADCNTLYAKTLLVELASPYSQELRNLNLILRWAGSWAVRVSLGRLSADPAQHPPYLLDLNQDAPS